MSDSELRLNKQLLEKVRMIQPLTLSVGWGQPQWGEHFTGFSTIRTLLHSIKNWMGPYQWTTKEVTRAIRYSGLGVRSVGPVGDFLDTWEN